MPKPRRPHKTGSNPRDALRRKFTFELHRVGTNYSLAISRLKRTTQVDDLFALFPNLFPDRAVLEQAYGPAFPPRLAKLFSSSPQYAPAGPLTEVVWAVCRCLQYGTELRAFVTMREKFERSFIRDAKEDCNELLQSVERDFGFSVWLLENRLSTMQTWAGIDEARKLARGYEEELEGNWLGQVILRFVSRRIEATGVKDHLRSELNRLLADSANPFVESYLRAKIFELPTILTKDVPATLLFEGHAGIIDLYEAVIAVLQSAASDDAIPDELLHSLEKPLLVLFKRTHDCRLLGVLRGLGINSDEIDLGSDRRAALIETYSRGEYPAVVSEAFDYLQQNPEDMAIQVLRLRANMYLGMPNSGAHGVLQDVSERLYKLFSFGSDTYSAAFDLLSILDRYYCHSWAQYVRVVVLYELRQEQAVFPPSWLRDIYVRDPYTTPFSAISANGKVKLRISLDPSLRIGYPNTWVVYDLVMRGKAAATYSLDASREHSYLARHHLAFGDSALALQHFNWLEANTLGESQLRAAGGAALANLKLGNLQQAAQSIVSGFVRNPHVPSVLPIEDVAAALNDPKAWPNSLAVPLVFELCVTYCDDQRLPHLRYAFERFLEVNGIRAPGELAKRAEEFGKDEVVEFLRRVWRPEIMRQTILYQGTREIEEARIKVCQLLAEMDPPHASTYLEEIKERVKQLEIAKGTTLMEQSKVYVDIEAIRRSLRTRLADSYARYKGASYATGHKPNDILYSITKVLSQNADTTVASLPLLLSDLHILDGELGSEADVQFEALFSEVTNEFLRGAHGLNAYLSTRIRHGTLANTLRKPVADERLVTSREEGKTSYVRNLFWKAYPLRDVEHSHQWEEILDALDVFSGEFDAVVEHIKDKLIQIKVIHELKDAGENREALFVYRSSNLERRFVQELDRSAPSMDEFVSQCVDILWEKTDRNLANVQRVLDTEIRERLMLPFTALTNRINSLSAGIQEVGEILNAVGRARTGTQTKLGLVISWFKRSEVYDRQDYAPEFPFNIALNMTKNIISAAAAWSGASIRSSAPHSQMPGRTLDGMVYVFYGLLENAILRSGLGAGELSLKAEVTLLDGVFSARVSNTVAPSRLNESEKDKIERLRESIRRNESSGRAQLDSRSGLHKIWLTINSPVYKEPYLRFFHSDMTFVVEFGFNLEASNAECSDH